MVFQLCSPVLYLIVVIYEIVIFSMAPRERGRPTDPPTSHLQSEGVQTYALLTWLSYPDQFPAESVRTISDYLCLAPYVWHVRVYTDITCIKVT